MKSQKRQLRLAANNVRVYVHNAAITGAEGVPSNGVVGGKVGI